jgi:nitrate/nitrite-specific signal transduction histidine kinase
VIAVTRYITELGWGLVVKIDQKEANASSGAIEQLFLAVTVISAVTVFFVSVCLSNHIVAPINHLTRAAQRIIEGDLSVKVSQSTNNEIHKDGHKVPILIGGSIIGRDSDEFIVFIVDLTKRKHNEAQIRA